MRIHPTFLPLALLLPAPLSRAQDDPVYAATGFVAVDRVAPGGTFRVAVRLDIEEGWHTQSHRPVGEGMIATELGIADPDFRIRGAVYPPGKILDVAELGGKVSLYEGTVWIGAVVEASANAAPGKRALRGSLEVQACNDRGCLQPEGLPVEFPIEVGPGAPTAQHGEIFRTIDFSKAATGGEEGAGPLGGAKKGLLGTLLSIFLLGLALNLTPCVYPVIAVTVGFFGRQKAAGAGRFALPAAYAVGIAATFTALGVVAALTGGAFGAWLQHPWVLLTLALLIAAFALSCFGLFEIQPPVWLLARVGGGKSGFLGAFLMGLTMGVTAAPCVGPLILTLLVAVATEQSVSKGLLWFGTLSGGLALPYVFLGAFSGSVATLPKAGDWTEWVKKALGFVLLGVSIWFANPLLPSGWLLPVLAIVVAAAGVWLGLLERSGRTSNALWFARGALCIASLAGAWQIFERSRAEGIAFVDYDPALLAQARAEGKPVMIDVTARWCLPCKKMEETTFKDARVIAESKAFVRLRVDVTERDPSDRVKDAKSRFGEGGRLDPPQILFLDAKGEERRELRLREDTPADELLERMRRARGGGSP